MAHITFKEAWEKAPEEVQDFISDNAYKFADKYLNLLEKSNDLALFTELIIFLQKLGVKYYEIPNLNTLEYLIENVLNVDKELSKKLAELIWTDFLPKINKVWQGKETNAQEINKETKLQKAIIAQIEKETEEIGRQVKQPGRKKQIEENGVSIKEDFVKTKKEQSKTEEERSKTEEEQSKTEEEQKENQFENNQNTPLQGIKVPIEIENINNNQDAEQIKKEDTKLTNQIPIIEISPISWEESNENKKNIEEKQPEIIIEEQEKKETEPEEEKPIDLSNY